MKTCPYCGKKYPDEAEICAIDQNLLVATMADATSANTGRVAAKSSFACPACNSREGHQPVVQAKGSFNLLVFLTGGIFAVLFYNAGQAKRVRCNQCEHVFNIRPPLTRVSKLIFWLLVAPMIASLLVILIKLVSLFLSPK